MNGGFLSWLRRPPVADRLRTAEVREDLLEAADRAAFGRPCDAEVIALSALLADDEVVQQVLDGRRDGTAVLLALTTRRLILLVEGTDPADALVLDRDAVTHADTRVRRGLGTLTVTAGRADLTVTEILGTQAATFAEQVRCPPAGQHPPVDPLDALAQLRALHQAGAIGDGEYQTRKRRLLDQI